MWQSRQFRNVKTEKDVERRQSHENDQEDQEKNKSQDSGRIDSGFLSGGDLQLSSEISESFTDPPVVERGGDFSKEEHTSSTKVSSVTEPMRATDSGVDLGLSESLSQLTLKPVTLNPLATGKIQTEPTFELIPVNNPKIEIVDTQNETSDNKVKKFVNQEPWQLYYTQDDDGDTLLHMAIIQGFLEAAFSLIRMAPHPCLLDIMNDDWQSPLHLAVITQQSRIARRLILAGANPGLRNFQANTALHLACTNGDVACAKALTDSLTPLERSYFLPGMSVPALPQDLEQRNEEGQTCLHIAASRGHVDLVRLLLRLGADLDSREGLSGNTPLHLAILYDRRSVVAFLLQECRPRLDTPTYAGFTAYQIALSIMDIQLARDLVKLGATPEPLPETDSDSGNEEEDDALPSTPSYLPEMMRFRENVVGV